MDEYISREAAISHPFANGRYDFVYANKDFIQGFVSYKEWLEDLPAANVKPVVRGEWEDCATELDTRYNRHDYRCPKCGYPADFFVCGTEEWWCAYKPNFCPNCGADMRKEANDEEA